MSADPRPGGDPEPAAAGGGTTPSRRPPLSDATVAALGLEGEGTGQPSLLDELAVPDPLPVRRRRRGPSLSTVTALPAPGAAPAPAPVPDAPTPEGPDGPLTVTDRGTERPPQVEAVEALVGEQAGAGTGLRADAGSDGGEAAEPARSSRRARRQAARLEARRVRRIIRRVDPWSVLKVGLLFNLSLWLAVMVAGVILWQAASRAGAIDNVESFVAELLAEEELTIDGPQVLRASALAGVILVVAGTGFLVLLCVLFNLISDITGGIRVSVIELETARPARPRRRDERRSRTGRGRARAE